MDSAQIVKTAYAKYNLSIGVGLSKVAGKVFRIGHLGNCDEIMSASALAGAPSRLTPLHSAQLPGLLHGTLIQWMEAGSMSGTA